MLDLCKSIPSGTLSIGLNSYFYFYYDFAELLELLVLDFDILERSSIRIPDGQYPAHGRMVLLLHQHHGQVQLSYSCGCHKQGQP